MSMKEPNLTQTAVPGRGRARAVAGTVVALLVVAACGQKPGVSGQPQEPIAAYLLPSGAHVDPATGAIVDAEGNVIGTVPGTAGGGGSIGAPGVQTADGTESATGERPAVAEEDPEGATTTGVTKDTIAVGAHAPLTGAAPVPSDSAQKGNELYWRWLERNGQPIFGRNVETTLKNDNYTPSQAVAVCKEMVERERVFLLYGFAGTDQIQACARYAASVAVPYLSVGVTELGLTNLPNYFALTLSYPEQAPLLVDHLVSKLGARKERNGMLRFDTPNFEDAHTSFLSAAKKRGMKVVYDRAVPKSASQTEAQTVVQEMKAKNVENVYVLTSPVWFLQVLQAARTQDYSPQWTGVGITMTLDTVSSVGCRNGTLNGAKFFSPFPAWADIDRFDPDFGRAVRTIYPEKEGGDDVMVIPWGLTKIIAELLERPGRALTRERFVHAAERARNIRTGVYPPVTFSPNDHLGGSQVHVNEAQCSGYRNGDNRWHTIQSFVSDF